MKMQTFKRKKKRRIDQVSSKWKIGIFMCLLSLTLCLNAYAWEEGGYCGNDPITPSVVYSFIKHFDYEQYYWSSPSQFTTNNNNRVDAMDFAYYCGHGSPFEIGTWANGSGSGATATVDLRTAGNSSHHGYGLDLEFIVFHSCQTIPSPLERSNWWWGWTNQDGIFDGLHQALGFRTNAWKYTAASIADYFGQKMAARFYVWQSWFAAINVHGDHGNGWDYGAVVMYPPAEYDSYMYSHCADPAPNHTNLRIWYQF